jgi:hypothetical protein
MGQNEQFPVSVVLYQEDGVWIAQGLQYDITARGADPVEASEHFNQKFGAELIMSMEIGDDRLLAGIPRAPQEFWDMYESAKMKGTVEETPIQVSDGSTESAPRIRQQIAITHERQRAAA